MPYASWRGSDNYGVTVTTSASANTKGAYAELASATSFDSSRCWLGCLGATTLKRWLLDVATGAAGSETVRAANLLMQTAGGFGLACAYYTELDVDIPSGTRIAVRAQTAGVGADTCAVWVLQEGRALGSLTDPATYGANASTSSGTTIDPGGTANTKGSYVEMTPSTTADHDALTLQIGNRVNTGPQTYFWNLDVASGAAGVETPLIPDFSIRVDPSTGQGVLPVVVRFPITVPTGTRLAIRAMCSGNDATDRLVEAILIGSQVPSSGGGGGAFAYAFMN